MKNIAVLINNFTIEYSLEVLSGVSTFFEDKDVRLIISQTRIPKYSQGLYEYQNWTGEQLLSSKEIDGVIIISGSYASQISVEDFSIALKNLEEKPIISIAANLNLKNCAYTKVDSVSAYCDLVSHLKNKHNCKRIAFMSANKTGSQEALERFESYKIALKKNNFDFIEDDILDGAFISSGAYSAIKQKYHSKKDVKFDSILCANDLMAFGTIKALNELGLKVPEDIKVIGFDSIILSNYTSPRLSTINQEMYSQGIKGAELAWKKLNGIEISKKTTLPALPIYRQSCGCVSLNNFEDLSITQNGEVFKNQRLLEGKNIQDASYMNFLFEIENFGTLFDLIKTENTMQKLFYDMPYLMEKAEIDAMSLFLYVEPVRLDRNDDFIIPESARMTMILDKTNGVEIYEPNIFISPKEILGLENNFSNKIGNFIIQPVYSGKNNYGFIICHLLSKKFSAYSIYLKILANAITQSYEYTYEVLKNEKLLFQNEKLIQNNEDLSIQSTTDELTKILNRRGFMNMGQKTIDMAIEMNSSGLVFFADMDNLKKINDSYGHAMGDKAIKAMASVLAKSLRGNDIVGRLSGDEFGAVVVGMNIMQEQKVRSKIEELCEIESKEKKFPFLLSCSIGAVEFSQNHKSLKSLLTMADERLYIEKRRKHQQLETIENRKK